MASTNALELRPIGVARTPHLDKQSAPRQPAAARGVRGVIELEPGHGYEDALSDLEGFSHLWVLFWFHLNDTWKPKVLPPRSTRRRGLFATRSPHRPNPLGISVLRLIEVRGLVLHVEDVDLLDGTPILDLKPYFAYTDAVVDATTGWFEHQQLAPTPGSASATPHDPEPGFDVRFDALAEAQLAWLEARGVELRARLREALALGPQPHAYRRIKLDGDGYRVAVKEWRARFQVDGRRVLVSRLHTGYRERALIDDRAPELDVHRDFVGAFGW